MAWLMLCVSLWDKPIITVSLYAPLLLCVHFAVLGEENRWIQLLCMKGTVTSLFTIPVSLLGGRCVFFVCLSPENDFAAFKRKQKLGSFSEDKITFIHTLFLRSFSVTHCLTRMCTHTRKHVHTQSNVHIQIHTKKRPHSVSLCLCLWEQWNLSLRFYSGLKNREMVCGV